jgi:Tol biopolymer transport system component
VPKVSRNLVVGGLVLAMLVFGFGVYFTAGFLKANHTKVNRPSEITAPALPGTIYLVQGGALYRFQHGSFTQITAESGWMQPAMSPDGRQMVAVQRHVNSSDLFLLTSTGRPVSQLTHNDTQSVPESNHWAFYPRFSPDGSTLFYDYDPKQSYNNYQVDLTIFASPAANWRTSVQWTVPHAYTGGDVGPVPVHAGLLYTKFWIDDQSMVHSQIWLQARPRSEGVALTPKDVNCVQPTVSPDQKSVAMICTKGQAPSAELDVATFDSSSTTLGALTPLVRGALVASPAFSPDGKTIAYLAPVAPGAAFQLWTVGATGDPAPRAFTTSLGLDSSSPPLWMSS